MIKDLVCIKTFPLSGVVAHTSKLTSEEVEARESQIVQPELIGRACLKNRVVDIDMLKAGNIHWSRGKRDQ